ncbi:MAG: hypothetical protein EA396_00155 [Anaerolineaceae bacterium]|nr:MAG: hypothetical protein EA396_00155 [Anaerolineaceae bacterium]
MDRRKVQQCFAGLDYDFTAFDIDHFIVYVQQLRQRPIISQSFPFSAGISGLWLEMATVDFIIYQSRTHPIHQTHIRLHEVAHMLLDHPRQPIRDSLPAEMLRELTAAGTPSQTMRGHLRMREVNRRCNAFEEEAEYFVELLQRRVVKADRLSELTRTGTSIRSLARYVDGLPYAAKYPDDLQK